MTEDDLIIPDGELVSDYEVILPWKVIDTCCALKPHGTSCFVSINKQTNSSNQLFVSKLEDNSIKIRITVISLRDEMKNGNEQKSSPSDDDEKEKSSSKVNELDKKMEETSENGVIANDNEKEEVTEDKTTNEALDNLILEDQEQLLGSIFNGGLSTVIIVKKVSPTKNNDLDESQSNKNEHQSNDKISTSIETKEDNSHDDNSTPGSKKKVRKNFENLKDVNQSGTTKDSVTCELCGQSYESYAHLIRHVRKQHRDCTFVRNYLEEIRPLLVTPCPVCKKNFTAKSSLEAHIKVSHGGQFVSVPKLQVPSLLTLSSTGNHKNQKTYSDNKGVKNRGAINSDGSLPHPTHQGSSNKSSLYSAGASDDSDDETSDDDEENKSKVKCDVCHESFDSRQQAIKHQDQVHRPQPNKISKDNSGGPRSKNEMFNCQYCSKKYASKELVLKHCLSTHFKSVENSAKKKTSKLNDDDNDASDTDDVDESSDDDDQSFGSRGKNKNKKSKKQQGRRKSERNNSKTSKNSTGDTNNLNTSPPGSGGFVCDMCGVEFNRMTLLVTHARYCRQKIPQIKTYAKR